MKKFAEFCKSVKSSIASWTTVMWRNRRFTLTSRRIAYTAVAIATISFVGSACALAATNDTASASAPAKTSLWSKSKASSGASKARIGSIFRRSSTNVVEKVEKK